MYLENAPIRGIDMLDAYLSFLEKKLSSYGNLGRHHGQNGAWDSFTL